MAAGLMVPADKDGQVRSTLLAGVVLVEIADCAVLGGTRHDVQVLHVAHSLEVSADDEEVHAGPFVDFAGPAYGVVDCIESAMALWGVSWGGLEGRGERGEGGVGGSGEAGRRGWGTYAAFDGDTEGTGHCGGGGCAGRQAAGRFSAAEQSPHPEPHPQP